MWTNAKLKTALTINAPSAGNCQLISCTVYINNSETGVITLTLPNSITNGSGANISTSTRNIPGFDAYNIGAGSKIGAAGLTFSPTTNFNIYTLSGGLDTFGKVIYTLQF